MNTELEKLNHNDYSSRMQSYSDRLISNLKVLHLVPFDYLFSSLQPYCKYVKTFMVKTSIMSFQRNALEIC